MKRNILNKHMEGNTQKIAENDLTVISEKLDLIYFTLGLLRFCFLNMYMYYFDKMKKN